MPVLTMVVEQKQGKSSAKKSKDDPKTRIRAKAFSRWFARYRKDVMVMSQAEFGNYIQQFIIRKMGLKPRASSTAFLGFECTA